MESTKSTQSMATKEETEEQNVEQLINLIKKIKVTSSFVEKLEKEPGYLEFQQEVDLRRRVAKIKIRWKRRADSFGGSRKRDISSKE